jgi:methylglutaconyl-CoA hydratase
MSGAYFDLTIAGGIATLRLNRPEKHNAFDDRLIADLEAAFRRVGADAAVRIVVLESTGPSFSAGADLNWMKRVASQSLEENTRDAAVLAGMMSTIDRCPKPVLGIVQGSAFGGGVGLISCCDIAIASTEASFCLSEVRLGLIPSVISPYVAAAIGPRACRRYFLTAERFDAATAQRLGLVHEIVPPAELAAARDRMIGHLLKGGPAALQHAKELVGRVAYARIDDELVAYTAQSIAQIRATDEAKEGLSAFLEKRKPNWQ